MEVEPGDDLLQQGPAEEGRHRPGEPAAGDVRRSSWRPAAKIVSSKAAHGRDLAGPDQRVLPVLVRLLPALRRRDRRQAARRGRQGHVRHRPGQGGRRLLEDDVRPGLAPKEKYNGDSFADGKAAMAIVGPWAVAVYGDKVNWGVVPVPTSAARPPRRPHLLATPRTSRIYSACKAQGTAWELLKFATSQEQDGKLLETDRPDAAAHGPQHRLRRLLHDAPGVHHLRRPGRPDGRGAERAQLASRSGRTSGTSTPASVIFGKTGVDEALSEAAGQDRPARRRSDRGPR